MHPGDVFIFTTAYDTGLPTFLSQSLPGAQIHIYRVTIPDKESEKKHKRPIWGGEDDPALGGRWMLRRDPLSSNPGVGVSDGILLEDDPLEVRIV